MAAIVRQPTIPGWYWLRGHLGLTTILSVISDQIYHRGDLVVIRHGQVKLLEEFNRPDWEWYGPLAEPAEWGKIE